MKSVSSPATANLSCFRKQLVGGAGGMGVGLTTGAGAGGVGALKDAAKLLHVTRTTRDSLKAAMSVIVTLKHVAGRTGEAQFGGIGDGLAAEKVAGIIIIIIIVVVAIGGDIRIDCIDGILIQNSFQNGIIGGWWRSSCCSSSRSRSRSLCLLWKGKRWQINHDGFAGWIPIDMICGSTGFT